MIKKVVVSLIVAGSLIAGGAGAAGAAPSINCATAPARVTQLQAQEAQVASFLTSLKAMEAHALGSGHAWQARWLQWSISFLTHAESGLAAQVAWIDAQCPPPSSGGGSGIVLIA